MSDVKSVLATWDELYLIYDSSCYQKFINSGLIDPQRPVWPIANMPRVQIQIEEIARLAQSSHPEEDADRMDRACERLILESLLPAPRDEDSDATLMQQIQAELSGNLGREIDLDQLAARYGLSPATFRRRWAQATGLPPAHFRQQHRLRWACELLALSKLPIKMIARKVGFNDELYFSRRFHRDIGMSPRAYRRKYAVLETKGTN